MRISHQFGALSSPASQPTEADFMGSLVMTAFSTYLHRTHSNRRCSKPTGPGLIRVSIMRDVQRKQRGRSMDVSNGPPGKQAVGMMLHLWTQAGAQILSVTDGSRRPRGDIKSFAQCQASHWSKLLTFGKIHIRHRLSSDPFHTLCFRRPSSICSMSLC